MVIEVGQVLYCLNGETVIVKKTTANEIIVEYKNKLYRRPLSIIGEKLLVYDNQEQPKVKITTEKSEPEKKECHTCRNCMVYRRGDCFGKKEICDDYFGRLKEMDNWPKSCGGAYSRYDYNYDYSFYENDYSQSLNSPLPKQPKK